MRSVVFIMRIVVASTPLAAVLLLHRFAVAF
jgi:hypothetical protein